MRKDYTERQNVFKCGVNPVTTSVRIEGRDTRILELLGSYLRFDDLLKVESGETRESAKSKLLRIVEALREECHVKTAPKTQLRGLSVQELADYLSKLRRKIRAIVVCYGGNLGPYVDNVKAELPGDGQRTLF